MHKTPLYHVIKLSRAESMQINHRIANFFRIIIPYNDLLMYHLHNALTFFLLNHGKIIIIPRKNKGSSMIFFSLISLVGRKIIYLRLARTKSYL